MNALRRVLFAAVLALGACNDRSDAPDRSETASADLAPAAAPRQGGAQNPDGPLLPASAEESAATPSRGREVRCRITSDHGDDFAGPCIFTPDSGGSFSLSLPDEEPIVAGVVMINVYVEQEGTADVRGLTTEGINSRWGRANRLQEDPACWKGGDFEVCAWA